MLCTDISFFVCVCIYTQHGMFFLECQVSLQKSRELLKEKCRCQSVVRNEELSTTYLLTDVDGNLWVSKKEDFPSFRLG